MRGGLHPQQSLRTPFLGGTVFAKPGALLLPSPSRRKERKVAKKKKVENFLWGKLGTTRNGETWFPGKTDIWEANRPHCLPRGTRAPFRTGVRGTRPCTGPALLHPLQCPCIYFTPCASLCSLRSGLLAPHLLPSSIPMEIGFYT